MASYDFAGTGAISGDFTQARGTTVRDDGHGESNGAAVAFWNVYQAWPRVRYPPPRADVNTNAR